MVKRLLGLGLWLLCMLAALVSSAWMLGVVLFGSDRAWRLAVAYDQLANTTFGGDEDETISSRAAKAARNGKRWGCLLCRLLDRFEDKHCENSIELDEGQRGVE